MMMMMMKMRYLVISLFIFYFFQFTHIFWYLVNNMIYPCEKLWTTEKTRTQQGSYFWACVHCMHSRVMCAVGFRTNNNEYIMKKEVRYRTKTSKIRTGADLLTFVFQHALVWHSLELACVRNFVIITAWCRQDNRRDARKVREWSSSYFNALCHIACMHPLMCNIKIIDKNQG